jgi:hypothetical protein
VDVIAAMVLLVGLALGGVQIALTLYARNVLIAAAHDGARHGIELGRSPEDAAALARDFVEKTAGGLIGHARVDARGGQTADAFVLHVVISGEIEVPGPVPMAIPFETRATASRAVPP